MIEAVAASVSSSQLIRQVAEQASAAQALSANPSRIQKAALPAAYSSTDVRLSPGVKPIFVVRDVYSGESIKQFPTEAQIRAYQQAKEMRAQMAQLSSVSQADGAPPTEAEIKALVESSIEFKEARKEIRQATPEVSYAPVGQTGSSDTDSSNTGSRTSFSADV
jgi:hypothetical protein